VLVRIKPDDTEEEPLTPMTELEVEAAACRDWEQGPSGPDQPALAYLTIIAHDAAALPGRHSDMRVQGAAHDR
jgi:hypothetical protein